MKTKLSDKQKLFCEEYLVDLNATQAAIRAKYSEKTAKQIGQQNLSKLYLQEYLANLMKERSERTEIKADRVLQELACSGFSNIQDYIKASENDFVVFKRVDDIPEEKARAIKSIEVNLKDRKVKFALHSKDKNLELIGRHLGMFTDKVEHSGGMIIELSNKFLPDMKNGKAKP